MRGFTSWKVHRFRSQLGKLEISCVCAQEKRLLCTPHFVSLEAPASPMYRATPPLSHLALAGPLRDAGYDVKIIAAKWDEDWRARARDLADDLLCVGVTSLTGPAVSDGLEFAAPTQTGSACDLGWLAYDLCGTAGNGRSSR
jgi:hypothetical protein